MNGAHGELKAHVDTPAGTEDDVFVTDIDDDRYAVRFMPRENGIYYVHIKFNDTHIPGSPLPMLVGKLGADPALVLARGDGLEKGESGMAYQSFISQLYECVLWYIMFQSCPVMGSVASPRAIPSA